MLLEAAEIILGFLGFGRTVYGHGPTRKNRKWWYRLDEQRLMARRNLCEKLYSPTIVGESYYAKGRNIVEEAKFICITVVLFVLAAIWL